MKRRWFLPSACILTLGTILYLSVVRTRMNTPTMGQPLQMPKSVGGLALRVSLDKSVYTVHEKITLEIRLTNVSNKPLNIDGRMSPTAHIGLEFRDSAGREIDSREMRSRLAALSDPRDFIRLHPGHFYGVLLALSPKRPGPSGPARYSMELPPGSEVSEDIYQLYLSRPGDYRLTVSYYAIDEGDRAGVKAWVGELKSNTIHFRISS